MRHQVEDEDEDEAARFARDFLEGLPPLLPQLQELARQINREYEVLTTIQVFSEDQGKLE